MTALETNSTADINQYLKHWGSSNQMSIDCIVAGNFNAEIALVGNYVHEREKVMQMPFVASLGDTIWNAMRIENITRSTTYQTIAIKKLKQSIGKDEPVSASKEEIELYGSLLNWELRQLPNLKYIVILGDFALSCLMPHLPNTLKCQGSVYTYKVRSPITNEEREVQLVVCLDPDTVMKQPKFRSTFAHNVSKLARVIAGTYKEHKVTTLYDKDANFVIDYVRKLMQAKLPVALDIEVVNNETACIGLANNVYEGLCINFRNEFGNFYSVKDELRIRLLLQQWFNRTDEYAPKLVMQNGMFDSYYLAYKDRLEVPPSHFDTMLASHTLASTLPHGLDFLVSRYTDMPYYKDQGKTWREVKDYPAFWRYNIQDVCGTLAVYYAQVKELKAEIRPDTGAVLYDFFMQHVMKIQPELIKMTVGGILADRAYKDVLTHELRQDCEKLLAKFHEYVLELTGEQDYKPNPNSPKQLGELLFTKLRLVGRGTATDAKNRARMIAHPKTPEPARLMLQTLNEFATERKFVSTYAEMIVDQDDRIRCEYKQTGVQSAPGRLSSAQVMWGSGGNLQNIPGRGQELFLVDEGYELSYFDLAQAEARIVGWRYCIHQWIEDFERARLEGGFDAHRSLASSMYKIPYDEVPKEDWEEDAKGMLTIPTIRYKSKRCRHGLNYTMQGPLLAEQINVPVSEGMALYDLYHRTNPELQVGWNWTRDLFLKTNRLYNAFGRMYINLDREVDLGNLVAFYFQSTIGDKVSYIIAQCHNDKDWPKTAQLAKRPKLRARMMLNIHDALIALHLKEDGDIVRKIMKKYAEEPIMIECIDKQVRECIIPADFKVSVPYKIVTQPDKSKLIVPDKQRWSNLEKIKVA